MGVVKSKLTFRKFGNQELESNQAVFSSSETSLSVVSVEESVDSSKYWEYAAPSSSFISSSGSNDCTTISSSKNLESTSDDDSQNLSLHRPFVNRRNSSHKLEREESFPSTSDSQQNNADISSSESFTQSLSSEICLDVERTVQSGESTQETSESISSFSTLVSSECDGTLFQPIPPKQSDLVWQEAVNRFHEQEYGYVNRNFLPSALAAPMVVVGECCVKTRDKLIE